MEINDIKKVGVVGAGIMGHGIACRFCVTEIEADHSLIIVDELLDKKFEV